MTRYCALLLLATVVIFQSPVLHGQQSQAPEVTFQVEVNYVDVDVVVTDDQGNFVTNLSRDDFEVFENGRPQKIDTFSLVNIPIEKPTEAAARLGESLTPSPTIATGPSAPSCSTASCLSCGSRLA